MSPLRRTRSGAVLAAGTALLLGTGVVSAGASDWAPPWSSTHNVVGAPAPVGGAAWGAGPAVQAGTAICTTPTQPGTNANTDCENLGPSNETSIAVNPADANNMIGGANDYQLALNSGGHVTESSLSRAHVTFDGGSTWSEYPLNASGAYQATGDPAVAFDADGHAYYATLAFRFVSATNVTSPDVLVSTSGDSGRTWTAHRVATGTGNGISPGAFLDKEYIAAWGHGNAIVTFGHFRDGQKGSIVSGQIMSTVTHDAGQTWTAPQVISGPLAQAFASSVTVEPDGRVQVAFLNTTDLVTGRDDYEAVEVSPTTGSRVAGPVKVATTIDGFTDYPIAFGRQTYQDSLFRTWAAGNITADPTAPGHLAIVWSDMRNSATPAPADPYSATTNSDVVVSQSFDHGANWTTPVAIAAPGDQFMPWGAYDTTGRLRIGTFDRSTDPANHRYDYSLATETLPTSLTFGGLVPLTTAQSDPTQGSLWFASTLNPAFPRATRFLGDYSNIAATPTGGVVAYWTDMRNTACFGRSCGHGQDAYFAAAP